MDTVMNNNRVQILVLFIYKSILHLLQVDFFLSFQPSEKVSVLSNFDSICCRSSILSIIYLRKNIS